MNLTQLTEWTPLHITRRGAAVTILPYDEMTWLPLATRIYSDASLYFPPPDPTTPNTLQNYFTKTARVMPTCEGGVRFRFPGETSPDDMFSLNK